MTGGHYSLFRVCFGVFLASSFAVALSRASGAAEVLPLVVALAACVPFVLGLRDRAFAVLLGALYAFFVGPDPLATALVVAPLALDVLLVVPPYGAWDARGRPDPDGGFAFPTPLSRALPIVVGAASLGVAGRALVDGPIDALDAPDAILAVGAALYAVAAPWPASRRWGFAALLVAVVLALAVPLALARFAHHAVEMDPAVAALAFVVLASFEPSFVPRPDRPKEDVFYDGGCGLCHRAVRFVLAEDRTGDAFRFAALHGETFEARVPKDAQAGLPDSIVVLTDDGRLLVRSRAIFRIMDGLGGAWRALAWLARAIPTPLADLVYDGIARVRHRLFAKPKDVCPIIPKSLRPRFGP